MLLLLLALTTQSSPTTPPASDHWARLAELCPAPPSRNIDLFQRSRSLDFSIGKKLDDVVRPSYATLAPLWREAGCTRLELARRKVVLDTREMREHGLTAYPTWIRGAVLAFLGAMGERHDPKRFERLLRTIELSLELKDNPPWTLVDEVAAVFHNAVRGKQAPPMIQAACPRYLLMVSDTAAARNCLALTGGGPLPAVTAVAAPMDVLVSIHRLWDPATEWPLVLASFSYGTDRPAAFVDLPTDALLPANANILLPPCILEGLMSCVNDPVRSLTPSLIVRFESWDPVETIWKETRYDTLFTPKGAQRLSGLRSAGINLFAASTGVTSWSLNFRHYPDTIGGRSSVGTLPQLSTAALHLSDLVIGTRTQGWWAPVGGDSVWVAPLGFVPRRALLELYFQVGSDAALPKAKTFLRLTRDGARADDPKGTVELTFESPVSLGLTPRQKALNISRLSPGTYRLEIEVSDAASGRKAVQERMVTIR